MDSELSTVCLSIASYQIQSNLSPHVAPTLEATKRPHTHTQDASHKEYGSHHHMRILPLRGKILDFNPGNMHSLGVSPAVSPKADPKGI
jgi:hypothetical protein